MEKITFNTFKQYGRPVYSLYCKWFLEPAARIIALPLINYTAIKPWQVTSFSLLLSIVSAGLFIQQHFLWAALIFQLSVVLDFVDGYIARIKNNGSAAGILMDGLFDIFRVMFNVVALAWLAQNDFYLLLSLLIFTGLHFAESFLDFQFIFVSHYYKKNPPKKLSRIDNWVLKLKGKMEKIGLKIIFLHYQERLFFVLFLGPVSGAFLLFTILGILILLFSLFFKLILDTALIKNKLLNSTTEYLRDK